MDALPPLTSLTQCAFCTHLNTAFATTCDICGDLLSPTLSVAVNDLMAPTQAIAHCRSCSRRLLLNNRSCAFCNALFSGSAVGSSLRFPRRHRNPAFTAPPLQPLPTSALDHLADTLITVLINDGQADRPQQPLLPHVRDRVLQPVVDNGEHGSGDESEGQCAVCLEPLRLQSYAQLPCCRNKFHLPCLQQWFDRRSTCPLCRHNLNETDA